MNDYYKNLPKKRMGSGALFFNSEGKVLIVKPTYKDYWEIPGGVTENDESPWNTCVREVKEELGLSVSGTKLLSIDYISNSDGKGERLMFIFDGGELSDSDIKNISLQEKELSEYRFVTSEEAVSLLGDKLKRRVANSILVRKEDKALYLENGEPADYFK
ncbi:MAG: NUDIX hydrolase [Patescibacteria group bacterium]